MVTYQRERVQDCFEEVMPLLRQHWVEVRQSEDEALNPDWGLYRSIEDAEMIRCFTMREAGRLEGYAVFLFGPDLHAAGCISATLDLLFLEPYRRTMLGARFIRWCDEQIEREGIAHVIYHGVTTRHDYGMLLQKLGYEPFRTVWAKRVKETANVHGA